MVKISVFGESHGECVGAVMEGFPAGVAVDNEFVKAQMKRRAGGNSDFTTPRAEADEVKIVSGVFNGITTGAPICVVIANQNVHSNDYSDIKDKMRPSHSDYAAYIKYKGCNDYRGGGHFSGRVTAPIVAIGAIAQEYLRQIGVEVKACVAQIGAAVGECASDDLTEQMQAEILAAKGDDSSIGGKIKVVASGVKAGYGRPFWDTVEGVLAHKFFAIPAVKAVEFGLGVLFAEARGDKVNDQMCVENGEIRAITNNCGGVLGGITSGEDIVATLTFKPTPSIAKAQKTVDVSTMRDAIIEVRGRHDPCIIPRACVVAESVMALGLLDVMEV
ncbi:MAG: chorismate synthase [Clostridiales bacterium]|jgi:chorismate synthase|nr:chorismate synthase [Clostridiales bacterium]